MSCRVLQQPEVGPGAAQGPESVRASPFPAVSAGGGGVVGDAVAPSGSVFHARGSGRRGAAPHRTHHVGSTEDHVHDRRRGLARHLYGIHSLRAAGVRAAALPAETSRRGQGREARCCGGGRRRQCSYGNRKTNLGYNTEICVGKRLSFPHRKTRGNPFYSLNLYLGVLLIESSYLLDNWRKVFERKKIRSELFTVRNEGLSVHFLFTISYRQIPIFSNFYWCLPRLHP